MGLLGNKCVRCGSRTRQVYEDKPTCDACRREIALALSASEEVRRPCPGDGTVLAKEIAHGIIIDRCPKCRGVWLDAGELERMTGHAMFEAVVAMGSGIRPMA